MDILYNKHDTSVASDLGTPWQPPTPSSEKYGFLNSSPMMLRREHGKPPTLLWNNGEGEIHH